MAGRTGFAPTCDGNHDLGDKVELADGNRRPFQVNGRFYRCPGKYESKQRSNCTRRDWLTVGRDFGVIKHQALATFR